MNIKFFNFTTTDTHKGYDGATITSHAETLVAIDAIACVKHDVNRYDYKGGKEKTTEHFVVELKSGEELTINKDQHDALVKLLMFA